MIPEGELRLISSWTTPTTLDCPNYTVLLYCMFITLSILLVFTPNLVPRCALYPFNVCQWRKSNYVFAFYGSFLQVCEKKKRKKERTKKMSDFLKVYISGWLTRYTSNLACVYSGTCIENLVLFGQETMELWTHVKLYFFLCVNILTLCAHTPFSWATRHTT